MNEQLHSMTGLWAVDALDEDERAWVAEYLEQDPEAAAEARSFEETAGELARSLEPVDPPPELRASLMAQISRTRQLPPHVAEDAGEPGSDDPGDDDARHDDAVVPLDRYRSSVRRTRLLAVAAAALMITTVAGLGMWGTERGAQQQARATVEALESAQADAEEEREMISVILAADDAAHRTLPARTGGSLNIMYSTQQEAMIIRSAGLPELPGGSTYQLWLIGADGDARSAGLITEPEETVMRSSQMAPGTTLGLTVEPAGGSEQPTTEPVLTQEL